MSTCLVSAEDYRQHWPAAAKQATPKRKVSPSTPVPTIEGRCGATVFEPISLRCDREPGHTGDHRGYLEICDRVLFWPDQRTGPADRRATGHERRWDAATGRRRGVRDRRKAVRPSTGAK